MSTKHSLVETAQSILPTPILISIDLAIALSLIADPSPTKPSHKFSFLEPSSTSNLELLRLHAQSSTVGLLNAALSSSNGR